MKIISTALCVCLLCSTALFSQELKDEQAKALNEKLARLKSQLEKIEGSQPQLADVAVYLKAVEWALRHHEFSGKLKPADAEKCMAFAAERLEKLNNKQADWGTSPGKTVLGYVSRVDESVQPYAITLPPGFELKAAQRWPLYVVLHGRGGQNEVRFIANHEGKQAVEDQTWIQVDIFGRIDNAYRWAGETDVFEAINDIVRRYKIDEQRVSLWGFSMGGAGAWHLGLQHPSKWASVGAGAGFVDFYEYQKQTERLADYQDRTLRIYDTKNYALNLRNVPFITYGGELDKQLRTSQIMQEQAQIWDAPLTALVGPQMGHKFDEESLKKFMAFLSQHNKKGRQRVPGLREIDFVTYTLKFNKCEWLTIEELEVPYERSTVHSEINEAGELIVHTENISGLSIERGPADQVRIDGSRPVDLNTAGGGNLTNVYFQKDAGGWIALDYDDSIDFQENPLLNKRHNLQGPLDDAFTDAFVCVKGTGNAWSENLNSYANWSLARFEKEFDKWMRAKPLVVNDTDLTPDQILHKNLILFGDPGSNSQIAKIVEELPIEWTKGQITFGGESYSTDNHAVILIYPNPLNSSRYVVINSGMTMHEKDFKASNAWLFPKLGDHAVLRVIQKDGAFSEEVISAGIFNSAWEFE